jgi:hypothetical protein
MGTIEQDIARCGVEYAEKAATLGEKIAAGRARQNFIGKLDGPHADEYKVSVFKAKPNEDSRIELSVDFAFTNDKIRMLFQCCDHDVKQLEAELDREREEAIERLEGLGVNRAAAMVLLALSRPV